MLVRRQDGDQAEESIVERTSGSRVEDDRHAAVPGFLTELKDKNFWESIDRIVGSMLSASFRAGVINT